MNAHSSCAIEHFPSNLCHHWFRRHLSVLDDAIERRSCGSQAQPLGWSAASRSFSPVHTPPQHRRDERRKHSGGSGCSGRHSRLFRAADSNVRGLGLALICSSRCALGRDATPWAPRGTCPPPLGGCCGHPGPGFGENKKNRPPHTPPWTPIKTKRAVGVSLALSGSARRLLRDRYPG